MTITLNHWLTCVCVYLLTVVVITYCTPPSRAHCTSHSTGSALSSIKSHYVFYRRRRLEQTKCIFSLSSHLSKELPAIKGISIKSASIKCWCEEKGQSIVWRIYSICIRNCAQFTNSLFYNLVHLRAAGGQIMVGL